MPKVHVLQGPSSTSPPSREPPHRTVSFCRYSCIYSIGYVVNLILIPFKAYISEPLPWMLQPVSLNTTWLTAKDSTSFAAFANSSIAFFASKYNQNTVPSDRVFTRDNEANTYLLRFTIALPPAGDNNCANHMHRFPGAIFYSQGVAAFVCDFIAQNATSRLLRPMYACQYDTVAGVDIATSCTWAIPTGEDPIISTYQMYHAVQLLETPFFCWLTFGVRLGLMGFIMYQLWHLYYRHYGPLLCNLQAIGLDDGGSIQSYVVQLGDPTWLILSHPFMSLIMLLDCFLNVGPAGTASCRTSQLTDVGQFCLGCLYGSRMVWASYFTMRYSTPLVKYMHWENYFQPVDPGVMALTASVYAGPVMYMTTGTPIVQLFQRINYAVVPPTLTHERVEGTISMLVILLLFASVPLVNSFVAQYVNRNHTKFKPTVTENFGTTRFNDWKHRCLFWFRRLTLCSKNEGGSMYHLFAENPRYKKFPLVSTRGSDCFVYGWDDAADAYVHQVRLSLMHAALDRQTICPALAILICPSAHPAFAAGTVNAHSCNQWPPPPSGSIVHFGAKCCQWVQ
ncbi:Aste57867_13946 [Aphanomyces stellatus]|uniref:Aste57867_13946 protein n=1 Tax=Aphanomyces stellatus TaxID=120398 RepID=A0A485KZG6_9STRA|nr:hypothetical protein As57867_013895 [Aphanomyces stellatus]VFT90776.1 Aste57867_13946 [Aphanomyces stellatus]